MFSKFKLVKYVFCLAIAFSGVIAMEQSSLTAERIDFHYSLLGFKLKVKDLADFAETGEVSDSLTLLF